MNAKYVAIGVVVVALFACAAAQAATLHNQWTFNDGTAVDSVTGVTGSLYGTAAISGGQVHMSGAPGTGGASSGTNGSGMLATIGGGGLGFSKTLVAWFTLASLTPDQTAGGPLGVQSPTTSQFDSICYGEKSAGVWMNGSTNWSRTGSGGVPETSTSEIMMTIVYDLSAANQITLYRNGALYDAYTGAALPSYSADDVVNIGPRSSNPSHTPPWYDGYMDGSVNEARIYDGALTATEVGALYAAGPVPVPEPSAVILIVTGLLGLLAYAWKKRR